MQATEETKLIVVVALTASQVLHETLDELEYTDFYRHSLKQATIRFQKELTDTCDKQIGILWRGDEVNARKVQKGIEKIAGAIATMKPSELAIFGELLEEGTIKYTENGEPKEIKVRDNQGLEEAIA